MCQWRWILENTYVCTPQLQSNNGNDKCISFKMKSKDFKKVIIYIVYHWFCIYTSSHGNDIQNVHAVFMSAIMAEKLSFAIYFVSSDIDIWISNITYTEICVSVSCYE